MQRWRVLLARRLRLLITLRGKTMAKKYISAFRVETNSGRIVGHFDTVEMAERCALQGRGRWVFRWFEGRYCCARQY